MVPGISADQGKEQGYEYAAIFCLFFLILEGWV